MRHTLPSFPKAITEAWRTYVYQVHSVPIQLVLLSATLPPSFIPEMFDAYNLLPDTVIVR